MKGNIKRERKEFEGREGERERARERERDIIFAGSFFVGWPGPSQS